MVDDNIISFPRAIGPLLRKHHEELLSQPLPQQLKDLLAMLEEACGSVDLGEPAEAEERKQPVPQGSVPEKPK